MPGPQVVTRTSLPTRVVRPAAPPAGTPAARPSLRMWWPALGGALALVLAGAGEALVEAHNTTPLSLVLYLVAIAVFTASAWVLLPAPEEQPAGEAEIPTIGATPAAGRRAWRILGVGTAVAVGLDLVAVLLLRQQIGSVTGGWLWCASVIVLGGAGLAAGRLGWAPRWGGRLWPADRRARLLLLAVLAALLVVAAVARLWALDRIPFGINADEGDRAATSIAILRGANTASIFESGWYWISMVYFTLLARLLGLLGAGYVQARVFGALSGLVTAVVVTWIGARHFGWRVGLLAGGLLSVLGVALQFARETSEAAPTALLWALSVALFLEAARSGRPWAWIGAGLAGGFSIYFYPTGRLWAVFAALYGLYLLVHGLGGRRLAILRGLALAAVAALLISAPFWVNVLAHPEAFSTRAQETSIFTGDNPTRLPYYQPGESLPQLFVAQVVHSVGIFNQFADEGAFWPTERPIMGGLLAVLTLLGLGWASLRPRDPRLVALALWFWTGFAGVIVTVETPNLQRMATAVPVLALFPALVLDSLARRVAWAARNNAARLRRPIGWAAAGAAGLVALVLMAQQAGYYFGPYAAVERWPQPTIQGQAVQAQGPDTLVVTVGGEFHMVNSGWVRLMAPDTPRGGMRAPGTSLPLALPAARNLAFMLYPKQGAYLPFLQALYPGGTTTPYIHRTEGLMFTMYRVSQAQWAATQGALAAPPGGGAVRVPALGAPPPGVGTFPSAQRWTAALRVPGYWNYSIRIGPGPARLAVDGQALLTVPAGTSVLSTTLALARGLHAVAYDGTLTTPGRPALFEWARQPATPSDAPAPALDWQPVPGEDLSPAGAPQGLFGVVQIENRPTQQRIDGTLATCCLGDGIRSEGHPFTATWTGTLTAPASGVYSTTLFTQGAATLQIDGHPAIATTSDEDRTTGAAVTLPAGAHPVTLVYHVTHDPGGLEWAWTPPGGTRSIVPPNALAPPPGAGVGPPVPFVDLGNPDYQPLDQPIETVP